MAANATAGNAALNAVVKHFIMPFILALAAIFLQPAGIHP
jgi:hypothetical protein